jgi:hypothetical protein
MGASDASRDAAALLGLLLEDLSTHFSRDELALELSWPAFRVEDALADLARAGLAHRHDEFAFPSRPAVHCYELLV